MHSIIMAYVCGINFMTKNVEKMNVNFVLLLQTVDFLNNKVLCSLRAILQILPRNKIS